MKKLILNILCVAMAVTFVSCSNGTDEDFNVSITGTESSMTEPVADPISEGRNVRVTLVRVTSDGINVRSGPGTDNDILGTANTGNYFMYISTSDDWNEIEFNGQTAYIHSSFCESINSTMQDAQGLIAGTTTEVSSDTSSDTSDENSTTSEESSDTESSDSSENDESSDDTSSDESTPSTDGNPEDGQA